MSISGIGSFNNDYSLYQSSINQIRLQQALSKNTSYQQAVQPVPAVDRVSSSFKKSSIDFVTSYNTKVSDVMQSANTLRAGNTASTVNALAVSSSDTSVADVSKRFRLSKESDMTLDVAQLATAQENQSSAVKASDLASENMNFTVADSAGSVTVQVNKQKNDGSVLTNREMLNEAAKQINNGNSNVTASVTEKDGSVFLELSGKNTGVSHSFTVSGDLGAADGLDQVQTTAQNAEYSITNGDSSKKSYSSESNQIQLDYGKIEATLKSTGNTTISVATDSDKIISAVSDLVNSYNNAMDFLKSNTSHGQGVVNQVNNLGRNLAAPETLEKIGITKSKDGSLTLDKDKLKASLAKDPKLTKDLISGSNGIASTAFNRATSAMNANSSSLLSNDLKEVEANALNNPINFMNTIYRSGSYSMSNYYLVGMMMNYYV